LVSFFKNNFHRIIDFLAIVVTIIFTLLIEGKFNEIEFVKRHPNIALSVMIIISLLVAWKKISYEKKQNNLEENLNKIKEENKYLKDLISSFKYQISKPLEDQLCAIYNDLNFNNHYRITVYTYTKGVFFSIGRYSKNTDYNNFGRIAIKNKNELLFTAWHNGEVNQEVSPDKQRKMPSQKIVIKYLYEKNDRLPKKDKFGVVVFETTKKNTKHFNNGKLNEAAHQINSFINESIGIRQDLNFAIDEGV
jgi:uncharacterized FlaG/YvyC family protein